MSLRFLALFSMGCAPAVDVVPGTSHGTREADDGLAIEVLFTPDDDTISAEVA